jgi:hypothetical protein
MRRSRPADDDRGDGRTVNGNDADGAGYIERRGDFAGHGT